MKTTLRNVLENVYHRYPNMIVIHRARVLYEVTLNAGISGEVWHVEYKDGSEDKLGDAGGEEATVYVTDEVLTSNIDSRDRRIADLEAESATLKHENGVLKSDKEALIAERLDLKADNMSLNIRLNNALEAEEIEHQRYLKAVTDGQKIV